MKTIKIISLFSILSLFIFTETTNAQRVVVKTPRKVVRPGAKVVYKRPVRRVRVLRRLPARALAISFRGVRYHYLTGLYYVYRNGAYVLISPPIGLTITNLPDGFSEMMVDANRYYYFEGTFYIKENSAFRVIQPPLNAIVTDLPDEAEKLKIDGKTYFQYNETLYKKVKTSDGKGYKVVGDLEHE